jgi:hypothetical protein
MQFESLQKTRQMRKLFFVIFFFKSVLTLSQASLSGTFSRSDYPSIFITFNRDLTFKYRFSFDESWDIACGSYLIRKDTVLLFYVSDYNDTICNSPQTNILFTQTKNINGPTQKTAIVFGTVDKRHRPNSLFRIDNRLFLIDNGTVIGLPKSTKHPDNRHYFRRKYLLFGSRILKRKYGYYLKQL